MTEAQPRDRGASEPVEHGRAAAARGAWREAYDLLGSADPVELSPADLELIGEATSWTGPTERCIEARERAFNAYVAENDRPSAARVAFALVRDYHLLSAGAVAAGWAKRAERLLEDEPECLEHGHLARRQGLEASARGDVAEAQERLRRALDIARRFGDRDLEVLTLHNQGSVLISAGQVDEGWALIDEAAAAAAAGDLRPTATGSVYCWTISACRDLQEVRRAREWSARFEQWCERTALPGGWRGDCRVHHAEVLRLQGRWSDAEAEAEAACEDFLAFKMPGEAALATYELGELQLLRGDLGGAATTFRSAIEAGVEPQPGLALLRLAEGKPAVGLDELTRALADVPHDRMERARLLPACVEVAVAAEQTEAAREALIELETLATLFRSDALTATACWARGLVEVAEGDPSSAVSPLREAVRRWHGLDAPYDAARARTALAEAYQVIGDEESATLELEAAIAIFDRLGAAAASQRAGELLRRDRGEAVTGAFLFSDICGSTSLVEAIGDAAWLDLVEWHDRTLRSLFREHGGEEVDHAGDGFFVGFTGAGAALGCAVAIQQALAEHRRQHGFAPPVRIGVHTAEAMRVGRAYRGKGIHAAARIAAVATQHEVVASREAAEAAGLRFGNLRKLELKGLSAPVEVVTIEWR